MKTALHLILCFLCLAINSACSSSSLDPIARQGFSQTGETGEWNQDWIGAFYSAQNTAWKFHETLNWVNWDPSLLSGGKGWGYAYDYGWLFFNESVHPWIWSHTLNRWIFLERLSDYVVVLNSGDSIRSTVRNWKPGQQIWLNPETFPGQPGEFSNLAGTEDTPLIIKTNPHHSGRARIAAGQFQSGKTLSFEDCEYVILENIEIDGGLFGLRILDSRNVLIKDLLIHGCGQEGIEIKDDSGFVDIIGVEIHDTGKRTPRYGEAIYIGSKGSGMIEPPDETHHVWVEGCEIYDTGYGEGIDISGCAHDITVRNNTIHDIVPGFSGKGNMGLIYVAQQVREHGCGPGFRNVWIEGNKVYNQLPSTWPYSVGGIYVHGNGVYVVNNEISDCNDFGIVTSDLSDSKFDVWIYGNTYSNNIRGNENLDSGLTHHMEDPGPNQLGRQTWYEAFVEIDP